MRSILIAGNWKMNFTEKQAIDFLKNLNIKNKNIELLICPPFISISAMSKILKNSFIKWGAQNVYPEKFGAFTGEISPIMLSELGCSYVICGHSERRDIFNENNEIIAKKVLSVIDEKMTPILCVGENEKDIKEGKALLKIKTQIESVFSKISKNEKIIPVIAYEPVWAIGTGKSATPEYAQKIAQNIRNYIANIHGETYAESVRILYGGSVNSLNISDFIKEKDIDGALIGGASLDTAKFREIYNKVILTQGV